MFPGIGIAGSFDQKGGIKLGKQECMLEMDFIKDWSTWRASLQDTIKEGGNFGMTDEENKRRFGMREVCSQSPGKRAVYALTPEDPHRRRNEKDLWSNGSFIICNQSDVRRYGKRPGKRHR